MQEKTNYSKRKFNNNKSVYCLVQAIPSMTKEKSCKYKSFSLFGQSFSKPPSNTNNWITLHLIYSGHTGFYKTSLHMCEPPKGKTICSLQIVNLSASLNLSQMPRSGGSATHFVTSSHVYVLFNRKVTSKRLSLHKLTIPYLS